jgi:hypothetical protein
MEGRYNLSFFLVIGLHMVGKMSMGLDLEALGKSLSN